jgi:hypothetical protein
MGWEAVQEAEDVLAATHPTSIEGAAALLRYVHEFEQAEGAGVFAGHEMHKHLADALSKIAGM